MFMFYLSMKVMDFNISGSSHYWTILRFSVVFHKEQQLSAEIQNSQTFPIYSDNTILLLCHASIFSGLVSVTVQEAISFGHSEYVTYTGTILEIKIKVKNTG